MTFNINKLDGAQATVQIRRMSQAWKETTDFVDRKSGAHDTSNQWKRDCVMLRLELLDGTCVIMWPSSDVNGTAPGHLFFNVEGEEGIDEIRPGKIFPTYGG